MESISKKTHTWEAVSNNKLAKPEGAHWQSWHRAAWSLSRSTEAKHARGRTCQGFSAPCLAIPWRAQSLSSKVRTAQAVARCSAEPSSGDLSQHSLDPWKKSPPLLRPTKMQDPTQSRTPCSSPPPADLLWSHCSNHILIWHPTHIPQTQHAPFSNELWSMQNFFTV